MSVIGPRPGLWNQDILTAERDKYNANDVKPGLHGSSSWRSALHSPLPAATETAEGYTAGIHNFYLL